MGQGVPVVVTGGAGERELCSAVADGLPVTNLSGWQSLNQLAATVCGSQLLICGDTGVAHLATALSTPSVLLFGPVPPQHWGPAIDQRIHTVLWHGRPGQPGDPHGSRLDPALDLITAEEVLDAASRQLGSPVH